MVIIKTFFIFIFKNYLHKVNHLKKPNRGNKFMDAAT